MEVQGGTKAMSGFLFVLPFRKRDEHLAIWLRHYRQIFKEDLRVLVIEQADDMPFGRGPLFNAAYKEEAHKYDYFIPHDCDMRCDLKRSDPFEAYAYPLNPTHVATKLQRFNYGPGYDDFFGGINIFTPKQYEAFDGFHAEIFGWGQDDDFARNQIRKCGFEIDKRETYILEEKHKRDINPKLMKEHFRIFDSEPYYHGLSTQKYSVVSREQIADDYIHIKVRFDL